jgi:diguanylate cyclase (GGDEF)-like protein
MRQDRDIHGSARAVRVLRGLLLVIIASLALSLAVTPFVIRSTDAALDEAVRHDVAWIGAHGREEFNDLTRALLARGGKPDAFDADAVRLAHAIAVSRFTTWGQGAFHALLSDRPDFETQLRAIRSALDDVERLIAFLPELDAATAALDRLDRVAPHVEALSRVSFVASLDMKAQHRVHAARLQLAQRALFGAFLICALLLVGLLVWHNRLLVRAHAAERAAAAESRFLATHDVLTRLHNRASLHTLLSGWIKPGLDADHGAPAVLMIDLDGFKPVNDVLGHRVGDGLLVSVAERLHAAVEAAAGDDAPAHARGIACRIGGDEFVLVLPRLRNVATALALGEQVLLSLRTPHHVHGHPVSIDASIGVAVATDGETAPADLINRADVALGRAKAAGKGLVMLYHPSMDQHLAARQRLERDLVEASVWDEFEPHYQPVVRLSDQQIVAVEALARWTHPTRGPVSPGEFVPIAEASGRIIEIGWTILEKACRDATRMAKPITVAVNFSSMQLMRTDMRERVADILARTGLDPRRLKIEVTESVLISDAKAARAALGELRALGVAIALDDFGTGYSSLSYLGSFPFQELKVDRSFVQAMREDRRAGAIVQTIIDLALALDMEIVAEGIEDADDGARLAAMGCMRGQGWAFGKPVALAQLQQQLAPAPRLARAA